MNKRLTAEERYKLRCARQLKELDDFAADENLNSEMLKMRFDLKHKDIPDDIYRALIFFINAEYRRKETALVLLFEARERLYKDLPIVTKENAIDMLCYRYQVYGQLLLDGKF